MDSVQCRPSRKTEVAEFVQPRSQHNKGGGRGARRWKPKRVQPRPCGSDLAVGRRGRKQELIELLARVLGQLRREGLEGDGQRPVAGMRQQVADRARARADDVLFQQPLAGKRVERRCARHGLRRRHHVVEQAPAFGRPALAEAEVAADALLVIEAGVLAGWVALQ